ncbi:MAG TPA: DUF1573 domain-containing protein [Bacteroidia bacterium]|nr:DUF1573 domain-containing protein [Bacteroidia bacterium]
MKTLILLITIIAGLLSVNRLSAQQTQTDSNAPVMKFEKDTVDYGTIAYGSDGYRYFDFVNAGNEPLIINEVHGSCGCVVATWTIECLVATSPKEPIQPGQSGRIKAHYDTKRVGKFFKSITVSSNANPSVKVIYLKGIVLAQPTQANIKNN